MSKTHASTSNHPDKDRHIRDLQSQLENCLLKTHAQKETMKAMNNAFSLKKNGGRKRKTRRRKHRGGAVSMEFEKPEVSNTSSSGAIQGAMHKQKAGNEETAKLNKEFGQGGGGDVVVPQMGQAGEAGNKTITGGVSQTLQGRADGEYDNDVNIKPEPDGMPGGGRRRRKTKKRRRKRKTKRRKRKRKSKKRRRKRKTKRRRR